MITIGRTDRIPFGCTLSSSDAKHVLVILTGPSSAFMRPAAANELTPHWEPEQDTFPIVVSSMGADGFGEVIADLTLPHAAVRRMDLARFFTGLLRRWVAWGKPPTDDEWVTAEKDILGAVRSILYYVDDAKVHSTRGAILDITELPSLLIEHLEAKYQFQLQVLNALRAGIPLETSRQVTAPFGFVNDGLTDHAEIAEAIAAHLGVVVLAATATVGSGSRTQSALRRGRALEAIERHVRGQLEKVATSSRIKH